MNEDNPYITPTGLSQDGAPLSRAISRLETSTAANAQSVNPYGCSTTGTSTQRQQTTAAPVALFPKPPLKNPYAKPAPRKKNATHETNLFAERAVVQPPPSAQSYDSTPLSGALGASVLGSASAWRGKRRKLDGGSSSSNAGKNVASSRKTSSVPNSQSSAAAASKPAASRPTADRPAADRPAAHAPRQRQRLGRRRAREGHPTVG